MTPATPGTRIRITKYEGGAEVGSVVEVTQSGTRRVLYDVVEDGEEFMDFAASHDCYEVVGA